MNTKINENMLKIIELFNEENSITQSRYLYYNETTELIEKIKTIFNNYNHYSEKADTFIVGHTVQSDKSIIRNDKIDKKRVKKIVNPNYTNFIHFFYKVRN